jgi:hypothetical protein
VNERERDRRLVELLLRLLGVYFVIDGIISTLGNGIDLLDQARLVRTYQLESVSVQTMGWTFASVISIAAGLYLLRDGRFVREAVLPERLTGEDQAVPNNSSADSP